MSLTPRLKKLAKWFGFSLLGLVMLAAAPVLWIETQCQLPRTANAPPPSLLAAADRRELVNTYLTYPEWSIVHAYEDLAAVTRRSSESDFNYLGAIRRFWSSLCDISKIASQRGTISGDYKVMLHTIGLSFALEMGIKGAYESTIGRLTSVMRWAPTPEDRFALAVADDYAAFLRQVPWYDYPFAAKLAQFWRETPLTGGSPIRKIERRIALSLEWGVKALYAKVIAFGAAATPAPLRIKSVAIGLTDVDLAADPRIKLIARQGDAAIIETDRYATFTNIAAGLASRGRSFREIAGNRSIMVTVFAPTPTLATTTGVTTLFAVPVETRPGWSRLVLDVAVDRLTDVIRNQVRDGYVLDHVYDY